MNRTVKRSHAVSNAAAGRRGPRADALAGPGNFTAESRRCQLLRARLGALGHRTSRKWPAPTLIAAIAGLLWSQAAYSETYSIPLFLSASNDLQQGFVRIVNRSDASGSVTIHAIDDSGRRFGPVSFDLNARATKHFNSQDLELGSPDKGLMPGIGGGQGDWRLEVETELDVEPLAYVRTRDGFVTSMHDVAPEADGSIRIPIFNPASNRDQASRLRLVNPNDIEAELTLTGRDDAGAEPAGGEIRLTIPAGEARTVTAWQLENGDGDITGQFSDGDGKWQLTVSATVPVNAMSLLESPTGHLTNLSTLADEDLARTNEASSVTHTIPLFMSTSNVEQQGFARIINRSEESGEVTIHAIDDSGQRFGPVTFTLNARATQHFNSDDLEMGNADKGLSTGVGIGQGDWRLEIESELDIHALAYIRTIDGFLTSMHDIVAEADGVYRAPIFNPGSNLNQQSFLRLVNPSAEDAEVVIRGLDDAGVTPPVGDFCIELPAGTASTLSAQQLEAGDHDFAGRFGDGAGKWQLYFSSTVPILAMSLLESPTGYLTNLSTTPADGHPVFTAALTEGMDCAAIVADMPVAFPDANLEDALSRALGKEPGAAIHARDLAMLRYLELRNEAIRNLDGLQFATNLTKLDLRGNPVADLSVLSAIPTLRELDASRSEMSDLASLAGLTQLTKLDLHSNYIEDLTPLSSLTRLVELDLGANEIADLTPLSGLTALTSLNLAGNRPAAYLPRRVGESGLPDLRPLASLTRLEKLDLSNNGITTILENGIATLSRLTALVELDLSHNGISTLVPLSGLTRLRSLDLSDNDYFGLTPLSGLNELTSLKLNHCEVHDVSALSSLVRLEVLELDVNINLKDLRPLSGLKSLRTLKLRNNAITDVSPLAGLTGLRMLDLSDNSIYCGAPDDLSECLVDVSPLSGLVDLTDLNLSDTHVADLSPLSRLTNLVTLKLRRIGWPLSPEISALSGLKALRHLDLSQNRFEAGDFLSALTELTELTTLALNSVGIGFEPHEDRGWEFLHDISALASLTSLTRLDLSMNYIRDLSPLSSLQRLTWLDLSNNSIDDVAPLSDLAALTTLNLAWNNLHGPSTFQRLSQATTWPPHRIPSVEADLSPLSGLANLDTLDLVGNCIEDVSPLVSNAALGRHSTIIVRGYDHPSPRTSEGYRWRSPTCRLDSIDSQLAPIRERQGRRSPFAEVLFLDPGLRSVVEDHLGKPPGEPILRHEMASIKSMDLRAEYILHLDGLRFAVNLEELDLRGTLLARFGSWAERGTLTIEDLDVAGIDPEETPAERRGVGEIDHLSDPFGDLAGLAALKVLHLSNANVNELSAVPSALSGLTNLEKLDLGQNDISSVSKLSGLSALTELRLGGNRITDLAPLSGLTRLTVLDIGVGHGGGVWDLSALSSLTDLTTLNLRGHQIADLSPLAGLSALATLDLSDNTVYRGSRLVDLSPLAGLAALQSLDISGNGDIVDLSPLAGLRRLKSLKFDVRGDPIDISALSELRALEALVFRSNATDLAPLAGLSKLETLSLSFTTVDGDPPIDLSPLSRLHALRELQLGADGVDRVDLSVLSGIPNLERLELKVAGNPGQRLAGLPALRTLVCRCVGGVELDDLPRLAELELHGRTTELTDVGRLTTLESLTLADVRKRARDYAVDLTPLSSLRNLKSLRLNAIVSGESAGEGLSNLQALETLALSLYWGSRVSAERADYGFLAGLTKLKTLELRFGGVNPVISLPPLGGLMNLVELDLTDARLGNLTALADLLSIETLVFSGYGAALDLSPLSGLSTLRVLKFFGLPPSTDFSPLSGLPALERLTVGTPEGGVDDISLSDLPSLVSAGQLHARGSVSLSNLPSLRTLFVSGNVVAISDVPSVRTLRVDLRREPDQPEPTLSLSSLPGMRLFQLRGPVSEIALTGFLALERVNLNLVRDPARISLSDLPVLASLQTWRVAIAELDLSDLPRLESVVLPDAGLSKVSLKDLPSLDWLDLRENNLAGGDALSLVDVPRLERIILEGSGIDDLTFMAGLDRLSHLQLEHNNISDIGPLASLPSLVTVDLSRNNVADLAPLATNEDFGLTDRQAREFLGRRWVNVVYNPLSDESKETHIPALKARNVCVRWQLGFDCPPRR